VPFVNSKRGKKLSSSCARRGVAILLFCGMLQGLVLGQDGFVAITPEQAAAYRFDFARNFFVSPEAEKADRSHLYATLKDLESLKGRLAKSADNLYRGLKLNDDLQVQFNKHYAYLYLRSAINTNDETSSKDSATLDAEVAARTAFLRQELMQLDDKTLNRFASQNPQLEKYLPAIAAVRRFTHYTLSLKEEELLSATAPNNDWSFELYEKLRARSEIGPVERDLFAFSLTRLASARTRLAQLRHFDDAASEAYFNSYWTKAEVEALLEKIAQKADLYKRYQRLRADYSKRMAGVKPMTPPRFTISRASEIIRNALSPLGADYGRELAGLLDPSNGRMDIVPGEHRKRGGFSKGFIGTDSVFYSFGFTGTYNDMRVLTHESTHAAHRQLMNRNHVLPVYAEGPHYLFEAFAIFNEFLLPDYLYNHESEPLRKQFYLEQFLSDKGTAMFYVAPEVALEHAVYEGVRNGSIKGADDLDALTLKVYSPYSISPEKNAELKSQWIKLSLMYEDPFYYVNYVYGAMLALNFYEMYTRDPEHFVPRYIALMKNGFDAPPAILLKRFLDIDLHDPDLVSTALSVIEKKVDLLEKR
jgi:oligoendopeptidase F